jgi:hypothetical protein
MDEEIREALDALRAREEVAALYLFGKKCDSSSVRRAALGVLLSGSARPGWLEDLEGSSAPVVVLNGAPAFLRNHVVRRGAVVFERDTARRVHFVEESVNEYMDQKACEEQSTGVEAAKSLLEKALRDLKEGP